jgi:hypothetical protein
MSATQARLRCPECGASAHYLLYYSPRLAWYDLREDENGEVTLVGPMATDITSPEYLHCTCGHEWDPPTWLITLRERLP